MAPEVQVAIITGGFGIIGTLLAYMLKRMETIGKHSKDTAEQVKNSHTTNLRDDIDLLHKDVRGLLHRSEEMAVEVAGLRNDLRQERQERINLSERLDAYTHTAVSTTAATIAAIVGGTGTTPENGDVRE